MLQRLRASLLGRSSLGSRNPFIRPAGPVGRVAGRIMALANAATERAAVDALELAGHERVLEVGFGPGVGVALLCRKLSGRAVVGIDPSREMVRASARRLRRHGAHAHLLLGRVEQLPFRAGTFDAVLTVNNALLWQSLDAGLAEIARALRPGGRLALAVHGWAIPGLQQDFTERLRVAHAAASFEDIQLWRARNRSGSVLFVRSTRRG